VRATNGRNLSAGSSNPPSLGIFGPLPLTPSGALPSYDKRTKDNPGRPAGICQQQVENGQTGPYTISKLMDGLLVELTSYMTASGTSGAASGAFLKAIGPDEGLDQVVQAADEIVARLFFAAPPLVHQLPALLEAPSNGCNVRLLYRTLGGWAVDHRLGELRRHRPV